MRGALKYWDVVNACLSEPEAVLVLIPPSNRWFIEWQWAVLTGQYWDTP